jgi:ADP-ribose pyrophosphatase YjhB (NUDIX family)
MAKFRMPTLTMTTDIVIFTIRGERLEVLLIERGNPPFQGKWALPGGLVEEDENLDVCARRELEVETEVSLNMRVAFAFILTRSVVYLSTIHNSIFLGVSSDLQVRAGSASTQPRKGSSTMS